MIKTPTLKGYTVCRFVLYLGCEITVGSLVTEPENSIIHQSFKSREREEPLNGDGFGIAWYVPRFGVEPALFKDITPAWNNINLINMARVTTSTCILAHVRAATSGLPVVRFNCHPFASGTFSFMHNGGIAGFPSIKRRLLARLSDASYAIIKGSTDSELLFALFMDYYWKAEPDLKTAQRMALALKATIKEVEKQCVQAGITKPSFLNLAVTDGVNAVATRYVSKDAQGEYKEPHSLYIHIGKTFICKNELCEDRAKHDHPVVIASEPLTDKKEWLSLRPNTMIVVEEAGTREERLR